MDSKDVGSKPSTPETPGTPGGPLFGGFDIEKGVNGRRSILNNCSCISVNTWMMEEGGIIGNAKWRVAHPPISFARKVGAEFLGTLILIFTAAATAIVNQKTHGSVTRLGLAISNGLSVIIVILSVGHISGAHLNPSVTIAFAALKHFPWKQVPIYIGAQAVASICAAFALKVVFHPFMGGGVTVPAGSYSQAFVLEFIISFVLMFVVTAVATDTRAIGELAAIAVGATVMLNVLVAGEISGASMNPVRTLGPAIAANNYKAIWVYLTAPILGCLCGAGAYSAVKLPEDEAQERSSTQSPK